MAVYQPIKIPFLPEGKNASFLVHEVETNGVYRVKINDLRGSGDMWAVELVEEVGDEKMTTRYRTLEDYNKAMAEKDGAVVAETKDASLGSLMHYLLASLPEVRKVAARVDKNTGELRVDILGGDIHQIAKCIHMHRPAGISTQGDVSVKVKGCHGKIYYVHFNYAH